MKVNVPLNLQRMIFYSLMLSLISYGLNYHIGKAFIHIATLFSVLNIVLAIKNKSLKKLSIQQSTLITVSLLMASAAVTLIYYLLFDNHMSERHFSNMFYPTIFFAIILPSIKIEKNDNKIILISVVISSLIMAGSGILDYYFSQSSDHRTSGFLNLPIIYASCVVIMTSWTSVYFFKALSKKEWLMASITFFVLSSGITAIVFTGSRGPIIVNVIILIALFVNFLNSIPSKKQKISYSLFILSIFTIIALSIPQSKLDNLQDRFQKGIDNLSTGFEKGKRPITSTGIRLDMWEASLVAISDHPLTGIGPGSHVDYFPILERDKRLDVNTDLIIKFDHMHNDFIQAWLSMGLVFGTLSLAFILYLLVFFLCLSKEKDVSIIGVCICSSFLLCGLTDVPAHNAASLSLYLLISCLLVATVQTTQKEKSQLKISI